MEEELRSETVKWLKRIESRIANINGSDDFIENITAYISDTKYFMEKGDLVRAFECIVWAWAWLEIGLKIGKLRDEDA